MKYYEIKRQLLMNVIILDIGGYNNVKFSGSGRV